MRIDWNFNINNTLTSIQIVRDVNVKFIEGYDFSHVYIVFHDLLPLFNCVSYMGNY